MKFAYLIDK